MGRGFLSLALLWTVALSCVSCDIVKSKIFIMQAHHECLDGDGDQCMRLALIYHEGRGVELSNDTAIEYAILACQGGIGVGCALVAVALYTGEGAPLNPKEGCEFARIGCDMKDARACTTYGLCLVYGRGVQKNLRLALKYFRQACADGWESACEKEAEYAEQPEGGHYTRGR